MEIIKNPYFKYYPYKVTTLYISLLLAYIENNKPKSFQIVLNEAVEFNNKNKGLKHFDCYLYIRQLEFYSVILLKEPSKKLVKKVLSYLNESEHILPIVLQNFLINALATCYFVIQDYCRCQDFLIMITLEYNISIDDRNFSEVSLMEVLCFYELNEPKIAIQKLSILQIKMKKLNINNSILTSLNKMILQLIKSKKMELPLFLEINSLIKLTTKDSIFPNELYFLDVWVKQKISSLKKTIN